MYKSLLIARDLHFSSYANVDLRCPVYMHQNHFCHSKNSKSNNVVSNVNIDKAQYNLCLYQFQLQSKSSEITQLSLLVSQRVNQSLARSPIELMGRGKKYREFFMTFAIGGGRRSRSKQQFGVSNYWSKVAQDAMDGQKSIGMDNLSQFREQNVNCKKRGLFIPYINQTICIYALCTLLSTPLYYFFTWRGQKPNNFVTHVKPVLTR